MTTSPTTSTPPKLAVNVCGTRPANTILQDIDVIGRSGAVGIGLFEGKFGDASDEQIIDAMAEAGLSASYCVPQVWTILPLPQFAKAHLRGGTEQDPRERVKLICESIPRMAKFDPAGLIVGPGVSGDPDVPAGPIEAVREGMGRIVEVARDHGVPITFELLSPRFGGTFRSMTEIVSFIDEFDYDGLGVLWDVWHSWYEPTVHDDLRTFANRINGIHITDVKEHEISHRDRALPGDGMGVAPALMATLIEIGWDGYYELEVFSDDGTFGFTVENSYWAMDQDEYMRLSKESFDRSWTRAQEILAERRAAAAV